MSGKLIGERDLEEQLVYEAENENQSNDEFFYMKTKKASSLEKKRLFEE